MTIKFQNTKEDYLKSMGFIFPKSMGIRWYIVLFMAILMVALGVSLAIYKYTHWQTYQWYAPGENGQMTLHTHKDNLQEVLQPPLLFAGLGIIYGIWHFFRARLMTNRLLKKQVNLMEPTEITFSNDGIEIKRISSKAYMEWSLVKTVYERPEFFVILFNAGSFIPVMRKHLSAQEYSELKKLIQTKKEILNK